MIPEVKFTPGLYPYSTETNTDFVDCFNRCYNSEGWAKCRMFAYDFEVRTCRRYLGNMMSPFRAVMKFLHRQDTSNVYLLKCKKCTPRGSIPM